jgi:hypothetical protein
MIDADFVPTGGHKVRIDPKETAAAAGQDRANVGDHGIS